MVVVAGLAVVGCADFDGVFTDHQTIGIRWDRVARAVVAACLAGKPVDNQGQTAVCLDDDWYVIAGLLGWQRHGRATIWLDTSLDATGGVVGGFCFVGFDQLLAIYAAKKIAKNECLGFVSLHKI